MWSLDMTPRRTCSGRPSERAGAIFGPGLASIFVHTIFAIRPGPLRLRQVRMAFLVRDLLGHKTLAMTGRYVERAADPLRALADRVADRVTAAMAVPAEKPGPRGAVVRMRPKGALTCFFEWDWPE